MNACVVGICSDDHGASWHIGYVWNSTDDAAYSNECQAAELQNNTVLLNARTLLLHRSQAISHDGGLTFAPLDKVRRTWPGCTQLSVDLGSARSSQCHNRLTAWKAVPSNTRRHSGSSSATHTRKGALACIIPSDCTLLGANTTRVCCSVVGLRYNMSLQVSKDYGVCVCVCVCVCVSLSLSPSL